VVTLHSNPGREIGRCFFIDPSVDFDFVDPAQLPDLVFDLLGIHTGFFSFQTPAQLDKYRSVKSLAPILFSIGCRLLLRSPSSFR